MRGPSLTCHRTLVLTIGLCCACAARADDLSDADAAFAAGEAERAEKLYEKLAEGGSTVARVHRNLAILYDDARRGGAYTAKAEALYRRAIALDAKDAVAHFRLGMHLYADGRTEEAIAPIRTATTLDAKHADSHFWLARLLQKANKGADADYEQLYRQAIVADPNHADAHFHLGRLLANAGRKEEAIAVFKKGQALPARSGHKQPADFAEELNDLSN